jgi:F0F1-type ATP synthase membrane subunit a
MFEILASADPIDHVLPHKLWASAPSWLTNQLFMAVVAALLMLWIFPRLFARASMDAPSGARNFFESLLEGLRVAVFRPALKEHTDRFVPVLWTFFFFILFCNLLGQIPIDEFLTLISGGKLKTHFGGTATGTLTTTVVLALCAFIFIHASGVLQVAKSLMDGTYGHHGHHEEHSSNGTKHHEAAHDLEHHRGDALGADVSQDPNALKDPTRHYADEQHVGHRHARADHGDLHGGDHGHGHKVPANVAWAAAIPLYLWNFAPHPFKPAPGASKIGWVADVPIWALLLVLELIGAVIKPFALMIRLFANMIAGHIVLAALILLITAMPTLLSQTAVGIPVMLLSLLIRVLELFVSFLQAYIFTFLVTLFLASAVAPEH